MFQEGTEGGEGDTIHLWAKKNRKGNPRNPTPKNQSFPDLMAKISVNLWFWKNEQKAWQEFPWLSSDCQGALVSTASTNASICILRARFTQAQFTDDSSYDSLSCPLHDSTILPESRQNFHSSVLVISISALARTMASSSLGTTPGTKKNLRFWHKKNRGPHDMATENRQKHRLCGSASWFLLSSLHPAFAIQPGDGNTHLMRFSQHLLATSHKLQGSFNLSNPTEKKKHPKKKQILKKHMFTNWSQNISTVAFWTGSHLGTFLHFQPYQNKSKALMCYKNPIQRLWFLPVPAVASQHEWWLKFQHTDVVQPRDTTWCITNKGCLLQSISPEKNLGPA